MAVSFGRFARARGNSFFARAFNQELPRRSMVTALCFSQLKFAEKPLNGFAEQFSGVKLLSGSLAVPASDCEASDASEEELTLAEIIDDIFSKRKFMTVPTSWQLALRDF